MTGLLRPQDLKQIASDAEIAKMDDELKHRKRTDQLKEELLEAFMAREIQPEAIDRINRAVRIAAEQGRQRLEVLTFHPAIAATEAGASTLQILNGRARSTVLPRRPMSSSRRS